MCFDGDFPIASGGNGHQASGAKAANPKNKPLRFWRNLGFVLFFFPYMQFAHCRWISQFGEISPKKKTLMRECKREGPALVEMEH